MNIRLTLSNLSRLGYILVALILGLSISSCVKDSTTPDASVSSESSGAFPKGADTYFKLSVRLANDSNLHAGNHVSTKVTPPSGDSPAAYDDEDLVYNLYVLFFDANGKFEQDVFLDGTDLVDEDGSGNLGASASEGITFSKAIPIHSGLKKVIVIANPNDDVMDLIRSSLVIGSTTFESVMSHQISMLPAGAMYPQRLDLPKYGNYIAPTPSDFLSLIRIGIVDYLPSGWYGLLMTGDGEVNIQPGVSIDDATHGIQNLATVYVDRLSAKVTAYLDKTQTNIDGRELWSSDDGNVGFYRFSWWACNMPSKVYLTEHLTEPKSPNYFEASDFSQWQNKRQTLPLDLNHPVDYYHRLFLPENLMKTPKLGNATYVTVRAAFTPLPVEGGESVLCQTKTYDSSAGTWTSDDTFLPIVNSNIFEETAFYNGIWVINEEGKEHPHFAARDYHAFPKIGDNFQEKEILHDNFKWWLFYPEVPKDVYFVDMTTTDMTKATQDAAALALSGGTTIKPGSYMFYYSCKSLHTNEWFDRMQVWNYTGTAGTDGTWIREGKRAFTLAYYRHFYCYYRVNLADITKALGTPERYAVNRNDWFNLTISGIKGLGFPDEEDIASYPGDGIDDTWLEVDVKVQAWRNGATQEAVVE